MDRTVHANGSVTITYPESKGVNYVRFDAKGIKVKLMPRDSKGHSNSARRTSNNNVTGDYYRHPDVTEAIWNELVAEAGGSVGRALNPLRKQFPATHKLNNEGEWIELTRK